MISWSDDVLKEADDLLKTNTMSYRDLSVKYSERFGEVIHPEGIRAALRRWRVKIQNKAAVVAVDDGIVKSDPIRDRVVNTQKRRNYLFDDIPLNGVVRFGALGDTHLASKYECLDELNAMYAIFKNEGITKVLHTGNYIEGDSTFNKQDVLIHGVDNQCRYFVNAYPKIDGIETLYIGGDDHEGWFLQREGIDVGERLEDIARRSGRHDLHYIGYMEKDVKIGKNTDKFIRVIHPGGGSAKSISYTSQDIVDKFQPYDPIPSLVLNGHYHKSEFLPDYRGTSVIQTGTFQDQSPFMRKKRLTAHIGGWIVTIRFVDGDIKSIGGEFIKFRPSKWEYR